MKHLVFQLEAPLSSWGGTAVGEYRGSDDYPGESALIGLLCAALGVRRDEETKIAAIRDGYAFAVGVQSVGKLLRDYHTAQVPGRAALNKRSHATRKDELSVPKADLNTILSTRDYRQGAACLVAVIAKAGAPHSLESVAEYLRAPRFVLYLGRKSCPPGAPLYPQVVEAASALAAMTTYRLRLEELISRAVDERDRSRSAPTPSLMRLVWGEGVDAGVEPTFTVPRKDRLLRRKGWQFADRIEHVALLSSGE